MSVCERAREKNELKSKKLNAQITKAQFIREHISIDLLVKCVVTQAVKVSLCNVHS